MDKGGIVFAKSSEVGGGRVIVKWDMSTHSTLEGNVIACIMILSLQGTHKG